MATDIEKIERRTVQYWFKDGIVEMVMGGFLLVIGLFFWAQTRVPAKSFWGRVFGLGLMPVVLVGVWAVQKVSLALKQKYTFPRTGYISYRRPERKDRIRTAFIAGSVGGILAASIAVLARHKPAGFDWVTAFTGIAYALAFVLVAFRVNLVRPAVVAVLGLGAGIALAFSGWKKELAVAALYGILAVLSFCSGWIGFRRYLRDNPHAGEDVR